jgi:Lrp/AsnC family transcriptional regulator for asnA, asnC and gidA
VFGVFVGGGSVLSVDAAPVEKALLVKPIRGMTSGRGSKNGMKLKEVPVSLDEKSKKLIELLQVDGRSSYAALAKAVNLSEAAVRQRVQRLIDTGLMQIVAVTDPLLIGFTRQAMIGIKANGDLRTVSARIASLEEVDYVVICAGSFDLLAEVVCENDEHLLQLLNDEIRTIEGVTAIEAFVYLQLEKQTYTWGTR